MGTSAGASVKSGHKCLKSCREHRPSFPNVNVELELELELEESGGTMSGGGRTKSSF